MGTKIDPRISLRSQEFERWESRISRQKNQISDILAAGMHLKPDSD
jgi:hypothetical protein